MWTRVLKSGRGRRLFGRLAKFQKTPDTDPSDLQSDSGELLKELSLESQFEALDQYLKLQNLRRDEEERLHMVLWEMGMSAPPRPKSFPGSVRGRRWNLLLLPLGLLIYPSVVHAADLEQTLRNLVTVFTARILPILALGYLAKNIYAHISGDPNAKHETIRIVVAIACLLGLSGVWNLISQQVR